MPDAKIALLVMSGATWFGGLGALAIHYSRRRGTPRWSTASTFPWKHFNATEWLLLSLTVVVAFALFVSSLRIQVP